MAECIYDNLRTFRREKWRDGVLIEEISGRLLKELGFGFYGGQIKGDPLAMPPEHRRLAQGEQG